MTHIVNNPALQGHLAKDKEFFGEHSRYAVAPVHTRFHAVAWFVWDAMHENSEDGWIEVIRIEATREEAVKGLL